MSLEPVMPQPLPARFIEVRSPQRRVRGLAALVLLAAACSERDITRTLSLEQAPAQAAPDGSVPPRDPEVAEPSDPYDWAGSDAAVPGPTIVRDPIGDAALGGASGLDSGAPGCAVAAPEPAAETDAGAEACLLEAQWTVLQIEGPEVALRSARRTRCAGFAGRTGSSPRSIPRRHLWRRQPERRWSASDFTPGPSKPAWSSGASRRSSSSAVLCPRAAARPFRLATSTQSTATSQASVSSLGRARRLRAGSRRACASCLELPTRPPRRTW